jgi:hypothetical protein
LLREPFSSALRLVTLYIYTTPTKKSISHMNEPSPIAKPSRTQLRILPPHNTQKRTFLRRNRKQTPNSEKWQLSGSKHARNSKKPDSGSL